MPERIIKIPGPDHPITIEPDLRRLVIKVAGQVIADTTAALALREADYPAVHYIPREDVDMGALCRSDSRTYCPYKGEASYFSIPIGGECSVDAVWSYEAPYEAAIRIKDRLAFYRSRIDEYGFPDEPDEV